MTLQEQIAYYAQKKRPTKSDWASLRGLLTRCSDETVRALPKNMLAHWPDDLSRPPFASWKGSDPRMAFARTVRETDMYNTYRLKLAQAVPGLYLTRQFTGSVIPKSRGEMAIKLLYASKVDAAINALRGAEHAVGETGQADLGGWMFLTPFKEPLWRIPVPVQLEVKVKGGTEEKEQTERREALCRLGICAIVADDVDDAIAQVRTYKTRLETQIRAWAGLPCT